MMLLLCLILQLQITPFGIDVFQCNVGVQWGFPGGTMVKNPLAMWETWVLSLGYEDLLEKEIATHSSILAWEIPRTEEPGSYSS